MRGMGRLGGSSGETRGLSARDQGADERVRIQHASLWALRAGLRAHAGELRLPKRFGAAEISGVHGTRDGCGAEVWRIAERRAWRWAVKGRAAAEDVWAGTDGSVPGVQATLGSG